MYTKLTLYTRLTIFVLKINNFVPKLTISEHKLNFCAEDYQFLHSRSPIFFSRLTIFVFLVNNFCTQDSKKFLLIIDNFCTHDWQFLCTFNNFFARDLKFYLLKINFSTKVNIFCTQVLQIFNKKLTNFIQEQFITQVTIWVEQF